MTSALKDAPTGATENGLEGEDAEKGKLFDVPRVKVILDESDPTILKLAFSGSIELERGVAGDVQLYNKLTAGQSTSLTVEAHIAGAKRSHHRDSEGDVDAIVETKSLIIHSLDVS